MNRELPQPGEKWRHFKGGEYVVIAIAPVVHTVSIPVKIMYSKVLHDQSKWGRYVQVFDTESPTVYWMSEISKGSYVVKPSNEVWHPSDITDQAIWTRPLDNFMGVVSSPYGAESSNCYRFARISS